MANHLAGETSPYLQQHADNPVDWYPWSEQAFAAARKEQRPILLSIGYAACHWCHVMAHESFEHEPTARLMNELFINIKVDREERPDLDSIYMEALQAMTGSGGWPMTMFLTPDGHPFYAGTYYPRDDRGSMPSFSRVLEGVARAFREQTVDVAKTVQSIRDLLETTERAPTAGEPVSSITLDAAFETMVHQYDPAHGGFGDAPKFPPSMALEACLARWSRTGDPRGLQMAVGTFGQMARGGIYDQVAGGLARYAVDGKWRVPHFEKMLYDNALFIRLGVHLVQATGSTEIAAVVHDTLEWARREMRSPEGAFYSSLDADSEHEEGRFYVWTLDQLRDALGPNGDMLIDYWGATPRGNFEGANVLYVPVPATAFAAGRRVPDDAFAAILADGRRRLQRVRATRIRPARDEKILAAWNGLMIRAIADAATVFDRDDYGAMATRAGRFAFASLVRDGRALRSYRDGVARLPGYLDDHAALGLAALALFELTLDDIWLSHAKQMTDAINTYFWDSELDIAFDTARDHETLITRPRDVSDNALPSGTTLAAELLLRTGDLFGQQENVRRGGRLLSSLGGVLARFPLGFGNGLTAADLWVNGAIELAIVGNPESSDFRALRRVASEMFVPSFVFAGAPTGSTPILPLLRDRVERHGRATAYVCRGGACDLPTVDPAILGDQLRRAIGASAPHDARSPSI